ncbi:hypothetical protein OIU76_028045 [Salix suchowensis]|nr:hypothetical protein OIU76_028045 [Salix suchowensis]
MMLRMRSRKHQNKNQATGRSDEVQFIGYALCFYLVTFTDTPFGLSVVGCIDEFDNLECRAKQYLGLKCTNRSSSF